MTSEAGSRPAWVSDELFPFESRFAVVDGHIVHYVDEGKGPLLLMLHGNPAWSFLYRHVIAGLRGEFRCVALDLPGFGLSKAGAGYGYRPADHATVVEGFCDRLGLEAITLMVNDWGGPIGFWVAGRQPARFKAFVIGNTWAWPVNGDWHFEWFSAALGGAIGQYLIRRFNLFVNLLVPSGHRQSKLTKAELCHYRRPFPTGASRVPTGIFPREITGSSRWLSGVAANLYRLRDHPALILWGARDFAFRARERQRFEELFRFHSTIDLPRAGHFIADDSPEEIIDAIRIWRGSIPAPTGC